MLERNSFNRVAAEEDNAPAGIESAWFETKGTEPIKYPPVRLIPQDELMLGDVFYHRHPTDWKRAQLWIWLSVAGKGLTWKRITLGHRRPDGKRLSINESKWNPTWVSPAYYARAWHRGESVNTAALP